MSCCQKPTTGSTRGCCSSGSCKNVSDELARLREFRKEVEEALAELDSYDNDFLDDDVAHSVRRAYNILWNALAALDKA